MIPRMLPRILLIPGVLAGLTSSATAQSDAPGAAVEAIVTLHIDDLTTAQWDDLVAHVAKTGGTTIEYGCLRSGVVVLRMRDLQVVEKADVILVVKRLLQEAGVRGAAQFLDIHMEQQGNNKC